MPEGRQHALTERTRRLALGTDSFVDFLDLLLLVVLVATAAAAACRPRRLGARLDVGMYFESCVFCNLEFFYPFFFY
jgi:hypothetical protein